MRMRHVRRDLNVHTLVFFVLFPSIVGTQNKCAWKLRMNAIHTHEKRTQMNGFSIAVAIVDATAGFFLLWAIFSIAAIGLFFFFFLFFAFLRPICFAYFRFFYHFFLKQIIQQIAIEYSAQYLISCVWNSHKCWVHSMNGNETMDRFCYNYHLHWIFR